METTMNTFWQLGRFRSMIVSLNYTWLIVGGLAIGYLAQAWLPPYLGGAAVWPLAGGMVILYGAGLLLAEAIRTRAAGIFSPAWPRSVHLFPFGAAAAYPLRTLGPGRAIRAALAAPAAMAGLGVLYGAAGLLLPGPALGVAVLRALAFGHLAAAALNLLPGLPLAGGWFLIALRSWMNNDREGGLALARRLGLVVALALAAAGLLVIFRDIGWAPGLALLALAWAIREGGAEVERRVSTRQVLETLSAAELMQRPARAVAPNNTLADVLWGADRVVGDSVLEVQASDGQFLGLLPVALADDILQGTWPTTSIQTVMIPATAFTAVPPGASLAQVLVAFARQLPDSAAAAADGARRDPGYVPVVEKGRLLGLISRAQVSEYEGLGAKVGVQEAATLTGISTPPRSRRGWVPLLAGVAVALVALTLLPAPATGPLRAGPAPAGPGSGAITFGDHSPATNEVMTSGTLPITIAIDSSAPVLVVTMTLQGEPLAVTLDSSADRTHVVAAATAEAALLGPYQMQVEVEALDGLTGRTAWGFRVVPGGSPEATAPPVVTDTPLPTLTPPPPAPVNDATHRFFPQTGHVLADDFLAFWDQHGGLPIFGYPLTDAQPITDAMGTATVQTFERARMEQRGNGPVTLALLGTMVHAPDPAVPPLKGARYFPATGHNLGGGFREFWEAHGGLAIFGYPISEEMPARIGDQTTTVQYFERARFEYHPEALGTPWSITLSPLGRQVLQAQP
jgi:hypothetical protein